MSFALGTVAEQAGYGLIPFDNTASTNADALDAARRGEAGPVWFVTDCQTGGRGRRGRSWFGTRGNLAASLLVTVETSIDALATLGFVAGLAVADAIETCAPGSTQPGAANRVMLKWPNDLISDKGKLVGILLETGGSDDRATTVVAGMGVNTVAAPTDASYAAASLADLGYSLTAQSLFRALSNAWVNRFAMWDGGRGMGAIRDDWLERAAGVGGPVSVRLAGEAVYGTFETIDTSGQLIVRTADRHRVAVAAGDVFFGDAGSIKSGSGGR